MSSHDLQLATRQTGDQDPPWLAAPCQVLWPTALRFPEEFRIRKGELASEPGGWGLFAVPTGARRPYVLRVMVTDELGWEHVSVALPIAVKRCPTWEEMCQVKELFWCPEDCIWQLHPPRSEYVNCHPYCLHLWRPIDVELPRPPAILVGVPG